MTDILGLTSTDAIRSVWGVSNKDLSDAAIVPLNLPLALEVHLNDLAIDYVTVLAEGIAAEPTAAQKKSYFLLADYSTYFCAVEVSGAMRMSALQSISDGNVAARRFVDSIEAAMKMITERFTRSYSALATEFSLDAVVVPSLVSRAERDIDEVTGS